MSDSSLKKKNRGGYVCSRCGEPKKGHVCKIQPKYVRKDLPPNESGVAAGVTKEVQVELDDVMTVRCLDVSQQGSYESYLTQT
mmetsp:Transcript_9675/g.16041  ORF Transcript_9675/g.16041 Transcript_9675/m.16041 type:complete len:83 (+) Transcript_9675:129-377(+)